MICCVCAPLARTQTYPAGEFHLGFTEFNNEYGTDRHNSPGVVFNFGYNVASQPTPRGRPRRRMAFDEHRLDEWKECQCQRLPTAVRARTDHSPKSESDAVCTRLGVPELWRAERELDLYRLHLLRGHVRPGSGRRVSPPGWAAGSTGTCSRSCLCGWCSSTGSAPISAATTQATRRFRGNCRH